MPSFSYQAISETGTTVTGAIEADSEAMAENLLASKGYVPLMISAARTGAARASLWTWIRGKTGALKPQDLILFTKQFRSMLNAGFPILRLMQVLEAQTENKTLKMVVAQMAQDIRTGATLYEATEKHPAVFSSLYRSMVRAGELSESLPEVLSRLVYIIEHETKIRSDIKAALQYPKIVVLALGAAFVVLLTFVIPKFVAIFAKAGLTLPLPTKIAMLMYQFLSGYWYIIIAVIAGLIFVLRAYFKTNAGRLVKDAFLLRLPIFGPLFNKAALSRFASIFAILHSSGVRC